MMNSGDGSKYPEKNKKTYNFTPNSCAPSDLNHFTPKIEMKACVGKQRLFSLKPACCNIILLGIWGPEKDQHHAFILRFVMMAVLLPPPFPGR